MIELQEVFKVEGNWYDVRAEIMPAGVRLTRPTSWMQRWWIELDARPSTFASKDKNKEESIWTHYVMEDSSALTLRGAWFKADDMMWDFRDKLVADPSQLPDREIL